MNYGSWDTNSFGYTDELFSKNGSQFFKAIEEYLPPVFGREVASKAIGRLIAKRTFANLDSKGEGPERVRLGRRVGYERTSFMAWLKRYLKQA